MLFDNAPFTLDRIGLQNVTDIYYKDVIVGQSWRDMMDLQTGIKHDTQIVISGNFTGLSGRQRTNCDITPNPYKITGAEKTWSPKPIGDRWEECKDDLLVTFWKNFLNKAGLDKYNLSGTAYEAYIVDRLSKYLSDDAMILKIFFANTAIAAGVTNNLTVGELDYFNMSAGIFSQMETVIATDATRRVVIGAENTNLTTATQVFAAATAAVQPATAYMDSMWAKATPEMKADPNLKFFVTRSWYDQYWNERTKLGSNIEQAWLRNENGDKVLAGLTYRGVPVIAVNTWDRIIYRHFNNGVYLNNPNRAVLISTTNWVVGTEEENSFSKLDVNYNDYFKKLVIEYEWNLDQKLIKDTEFVYAY